MHPLAFHFRWKVEMRKWLVNNTSVYFFSSPGLLEHGFMKKTAREKRWSARVSRLKCTRSPRPVDRGRPQCPVSYPDNNSASRLLLKEAGPGIVGPLTTLFNKSLNLQQVPLEWKNAVVIPIYKGGRKDRQNPTSYRPISLTSCVARLMEKLLNTQILRYLQSHSLIFQHQSGFLPNHSTVTQLCFLVQKWQMAIDKGEHVQAAFLDLSKAYDRVGIQQAWSANCQHLDFRVLHSPG